ncbi:MAG TPA: hypothetical protein VG733_00535 [Chthoniobacteraceae bacterium]|nr:hypothetical protein [Chthoniobacteraceae bacterium]
MILRPLRHKKKLDARMVMLAWSSMLAALFLVGGIFGGKHHPVTNSAKPLRRIYSFKHPAPTLAQR